MKFQGFTAPEAFFKLVGPVSEGNKMYLFLALMKSNLLVF